MQLLFCSLLSYRRTTLETRLTATRNEVASMEARADPMARQPALQADVSRLQGEACAAVRPAPATSGLRCGPSRHSGRPGGALRT